MVTFKSAIRICLPALLTAVCLSPGVVAPASAETTAPPLIATVDLLKLQSPDGGWTKWTNIAASLHADEQAYQDVMSKFAGADGQTEAAIPPVDAETYKLWIGLEEKNRMNPTTMSDAEKKALQEYEAKGAAATRRLIELDQKGNNATPAESDERTRLHAAQASVNAALVQQAADYRKQMQTNLSKAQESLLADIDTAVTKVAEDLRVSYVFNASFVSQLGGTQRTVLFSSDKGMDITDKVLKKLNSMK